MKPSSALVVLFGVLHAALLTGCTTIEIPSKIGPDGGAMTESLACVYDADRVGPWYIVFMHGDGLLAANHRHDRGIHVFFSEAGDIVFQCRCSGRGEVIDIMGGTFRLRRGTVFLCDLDGQAPRTRQLPIAAVRCDGNDRASLAKAIHSVEMLPEVEQFLSDEAVADRGKGATNVSR